MENLDDKIEPYLLGKLPEADKRAFETAMSTDARLARSVAEQRVLLERLEALRLRKKVKKALAQTSSSSTRVVPILKDRVFWTVAASLLVLAAALWFFKQKSGNPAPGMAEQPQVPVGGSPAAEGGEKSMQDELPANPGISKPYNPNETRSRLTALARKFHRPPGSAFVRDATENSEPADAEKMIRLAALEFDKGNYTLVAAYLKSDAYVTGDEQAQMLRAHARFNISQYQGAAADFNALQNSFRYKYEAQWNYLVCQLALGKLDEVRSLLSKMTTEPEFPFYKDALQLKAEIR